MPPDASWSTKWRTAGAIVEQRKLRVYDFSCPESEKHVCACQLRCENPKGKQCQKGIAVCAKHAAQGCAYVVTNPSGEWATLKRLPTAKEEAEFRYPGKDLDAAGLAAERPALEREGRAQRANYSAAGGFAGALRRGGVDALTSAATRSAGPRRRVAGAERPTVALVALSYRTPATLRRSVVSWWASGLLGLAAVGAGRAVRARRGPAAAAAGPAAPGREARGADHRRAFAAALAASSTHVLFLEKDFGVAPSHNPDSLARELAASVVALRRGAAIVRLRSITDQGCGTFRRCQRDANMPDWKAQTTFGRRRNWWSFYCPEFSKPGSVADCETGGDVTLRCFTSWDSNWSLNAVLVDRESALEKKWKYARKGAAGKFGLGLALAQYAAATWQKQDGFEVGMLKDDWGKLDMPICLSLRGIFEHVEVDG
ncbi:hypothetical protein JL720_15351 [Aureococcus anophagefferens]|nr:hypothetical protein JL720_15351 [Aureococcus anophagefferens]